MRTLGGVSLPAGWTARRPDLDDVPTILAVVHASDIASVGEPDYSAEEVREKLTAPNFDPDRDSWLAVHPELGLPAQALLLARALAGYAGRGREYAGLGVDLTNPTEAANLYRSVGMVAQYESDIYHREVTATR